jgi:hypothetical protein
MFALLQVEQPEIAQVTRIRMPQCHGRQGCPVVFVMVYIQVTRRGHEAPLGDTVNRMQPAVKSGDRTGLTQIYLYPGILCVSNRGRHRRDKPTAVATWGRAGSRRHNGVARQGRALADRAAFYERGRSRGA